MAARNRKSATQIRRVNVPYTQPEWGYFLDDIQPYILWPAFTLLYGGWMHSAVWHNTFALGLPERLFAAIAALPATFMMAFYLTLALLTIFANQGATLGAGRCLRGEFIRGRFRLLIGRQWHIFDANAPHEFALREHDSAREEARAEERARAYGAAQISDHYRRARQITLDYCGERFVLASVADERQARRLIRMLQSFDSWSRGSGAGVDTAHVDRNERAPTNTRPTLE